MPTKIMHVKYILMVPCGWGEENGSRRKGEEERYYRVCLNS
jgi:hypothetical protein